MPRESVEIEKYVHKKFFIFNVFQTRNIQQCLMFKLLKFVSVTLVTLIKFFVFYIILSILIRTINKKISIKLSLEISEYCHFT